MGIEIEWLDDPSDAKDDLEDDFPIRPDLSMLPDEVTPEQRYPMEQIVDEYSDLFLRNLKAIGRARG